MFEGMFQPMAPGVMRGWLRYVLPFWQIFKKAGFSPWLSLLMMIPFVGRFLLYYLAFAKWPKNSK